MKQTSAYCATCGKQTLHAKEGISNVLHLILSIVTVGLWIPVWIFLGLKSSGTRMRCQVCGTKRGASAPHSPEPAVVGKDCAPAPRDHSAQPHS